MAAVARSGWTGHRIAGIASWTLAGVILVVYLYAFSTGGGRAAFSRDNQATTYFMLGAMLVFAVAGALLTALAALRARVEAIAAKLGVEV